MLDKNEVIYPSGSDIEISHHFGIKIFYEMQIIMITVVNRDYCKNLISVLPNQNHPEQYPLKKKKHFMFLRRRSALFDGEHFKMKMLVTTINPGVKHSFSSKGGCVIEEISSTHFVDDSYYTDERILQNKK